MTVYGEIAFLQLPRRQNKMKSKSLICLALFAICGSSFAQTSIKISRSVWSGLTAEEREKVHSKFIVQVRSPDDFGVIIDNQGVDESRPGTNGGAALGSALAQTTYIDRAIKGGNYSATSQLGLALVGAVIGSSLDSKGVQQYHFRYAVRLSSGEVKYVDHVQSNAFRHPNGICVSYPSVAPIDEGICSLTVDSFRAKFLEESAARPVSTSAASVPPESGGGQNFAATSPTQTGEVDCKSGTLPTVRTTAAKCTLIGGSVVQ